MVDLLDKRCEATVTRIDDGLENKRIEVLIEGRSEVSKEEVRAVIIEIAEWRGDKFCRWIKENYGMLA